MAKELYTSPACCGHYGLLQAELLVGLWFGVASNEATMPWLFRSLSKPQPNSGSLICKVPKLCCVAFSYWVPVLFKIEYQQNGYPVYYGNTGEPSVFRA